MAFPPRISGRALGALVKVSRTSAGASVLYQVLRADLRIARLEALSDALFGEMPVDNRPVAGRPPRVSPEGNLPSPAPPWSATSATLADAYRAKKTTPRDVVDTALAAAGRLALYQPSMGPLLASLDEEARREADASSERWKRGAPRGPLDGVPVVIKEEMAIRGLPTRAGTDLNDA